MQNLFIYKLYTFVKWNRTEEKLYRVSAIFFLSLWRNWNATNFPTAETKSKHENVCHLCFESRLSVHARCCLTSLCHFASVCLHHWVCVSSLFMLPRCLLHLCPPTDDSSDEEVTPVLNRFTRKLAFQLGTFDADGMLTLGDISIRRNDAEYWLAVCICIIINTGIQTIDAIVILGAVSDQFKFLVPQEGDPSTISCTCTIVWEPSM